MRLPALGEAATQLPWLCPCASSLVALARKPAAAAWREVRDDPGAVLLILRQAARTGTSPAPAYFPSLLRDPCLVQGAIRLLHATEPEPAKAGTPILPFSPSTPLPCAHVPSGFVDWRLAGSDSVYRACLLYARTAHDLADMSRRGDPDHAWVAGLLAPLGWLAVCAVDSADVTACLADPAFADDPVLYQQRRWGYAHAEIARRLARRWRLPNWLAVLVGHLGLPHEIALELGAEPNLFPIVQLAVGLVQKRGLGLRLTVGGDAAASAAALGLSLSDVSEKVAEWERGARTATGESPPLGEATALALSRSAPGVPTRWTSPHETPLLTEVLSLAAENMRLHDSPMFEQLERERDRLHQALENQRHGEAVRLQALKMTALAEFAAGAAHEINNPLAVISGQAQYLLGREIDPARQRALQTINGQAHRIHQLLNELMQFARPPHPQMQAVDLRGLLREVALSLSDLAAQRQVQLTCPDPDPALTLCADPRLLRTALECLLRNAIEAAPPGGWAGIRVAPADDDRLEFVVEDNGTGPAPSQRDHLFDPFYSGRLAGRGRGFGLPTAWRLAREHGGDVRFDRPADGPTQFILNVPRQGPDHDQAVKHADQHQGHNASKSGTPLSSGHPESKNAHESLRQAV